MNYIFYPNVQEYFLHYNDSEIAIILANYVEIVIYLIEVVNTKEML